LSGLGFFSELKLFDDFFDIIWFVLNTLDLEFEDFDELRKIQLLFADKSFFEHLSHSDLQLEHILGPFFFFFHQSDDTILHNSNINVEFLQEFFLSIFNEIFNFLIITNCQIGIQSRMFLQNFSSILPITYSQILELLRSNSHRCIENRFYGVRLENVFVGEKLDFDLLCLLFELFFPH